MKQERHTLKIEILRRFTSAQNSYWKFIGKLIGSDIQTNKAAQKRISLQLSLILIASCAVAIFVAAPKSEAVVVTDCSAIGQLRNGGFEAPVAGTTVISDAGTTYPQTSDTAARQDSNNSVTNAVYGLVGDTNWNHLDASADTSTYRTYSLPGRTGDARVYWNTTEASEQIELGSFVTAQAGSRFAELNSAVQAALYQDIPTIPGVTIRWSLAHRGRDGTDTMRVYIGKPTNTAATVRGSAARFNGNALSSNTTLQNNSATRTNSARAGLSLASARAAGSTTLQTDIADGQTWRFWYGTYEEASTTTTNTRFMFESVSPIGGSGNLLDSITFAPVAACPIERTYNSPTETQTVTIFDSTAGSFAMVPDETGHTESVTALTKVDGSGPGTATINTGGRTLNFVPNGSGTTTFNYTIRYIANGIASTSDGTISITARDVFGAANCNPGSVETQTSTTSGQSTVILTFKTPVQANTNDDADHRSATCTWTVPDGVNAVDYLVVGGGGGGASGGGGGGGVVTSWRTVNANNTGTERTAARNPLAVTAGEVINITVGGGGEPGWGGNERCSHPSGTTTNPCTIPNSTTRLQTSGANSSFGSVVAAGGGFGGGGSGTAGGGSGGSGGGSQFDSAASSGTASGSSIIGASSFGNRGGGSAGGSYQAGGGGGGAGDASTVSATPSNGTGGIGGNNRTINSTGGTAGNGRFVSGSIGGGGGHGGRGLMSNIASLNGATFVEYGCGGGGGINDNTNTTIADAGGLPGCDGAGRGSNWATWLTTTSNTAAAFNAATCTAVADSACNSTTQRITSVQFNGTTVPPESRGGGGGGTDPEGDQAGSGGSGVVVIRYIVSSINCPNSSNNTNLAGPIACPYPITITAGAAASTRYNLSYGDATNGYVSFPGGSADTVTVTTTIANGIDTVTVTADDATHRIKSFAVSNANTLLAGATYPLRYTIFSGSSSSSDYILLRIVDPAQATPVVIPVDPRATTVDLSPVRIGGSQMTQVCYTPVDDNDNTGYGNIPTIETITARSTETYTITAALGRIRLQGTSTNLQAAVANIRVRKHPSDTYLLPSDKSRFIRINVSNGTVGGNGSCTFGNESILELKPLSIQQTVVKPQVTLTRNNQ